MSRLRPTIAAALLVVSLLAPAGARPSWGGAAMTPGVPWMGAVAVRQSVARLMTVADPALPAGPAPREMAPPDRSRLPQAGVVDRASWVPSEERLSPSSDATAPMVAGPQTPSTTFVGATLAGAHPTNSFPADVMGDVGPSQYIVFVNGRIASYSKATGLADGVLDVTPDAFFSTVSAGSPTRNPRIRYDRLTGRWILTIINTATPNRVLIAVSDAASSGVITGSTVFSFYFFPIDTPPPAIANTCFADHVTLGVDVNALYIGADEYCSGSYNSSDGFVVRKSSVLSGGPLVVTALRGLVPNPSSDGPYAPQGVDNDDPTFTEGYFIGVSNVLFGKLELRRVASPGGSPFVSTNIDVPVSATAFPILVPHVGNTQGVNGYLSAVDDRLTMARMRGGRLWTVHNIAVNNAGTTGGVRTRNGARWYELQGIATPGTPSVFQSGTVFAATAGNTTDQAHFWMPSLMVSGQGHALLGCSTAGTLLRIDAVTTGRLASNTLGTMATPTNYTASNTEYNPPGDPGGPTGRRWGDYSYTSVDPIDDMTFWTIQGWCDGANSYGCQVIKMVAPGPATPTSATDVGAGVTSTMSTVTGVATNGRGFFDPGPNLPGGVAYSHISAVVTNAGVTGTPPTVNGVTVVDPTHVKLDLNTSAATQNLPGERYTVVITNPDGQVATGTQILRMLGPIGVGDGPEAEFRLPPVWPNPVRTSARVNFELAREARVRLTIVDLAGREVAVLADGVQSAGSHHANWDGAAAAPAGVYFVRYQAEGRELTRRFVLLR